MRSTSATKTWNGTFWMGEILDGRSSTLVLSSNDSIIVTMANVLVNWVNIISSLMVLGQLDWMIEFFHWQHLSQNSWTTNNLIQTHTWPKDNVLLKLTKSEIDRSVSIMTTPKHQNKNDKWGRLKYSSKIVTSKPCRLESATLTKRDTT